YFMDAVADTIWELDFGTLERYRGNYSHYVQQREERHERLWKEFEAQQEFIAKEEDYIRRNIAGQNTRQAKGRRTRLERLKRDELIRRPRSRRDLTLRLAESGRSGEQVIMTRGLRVGYPGKILFDAPDITLRRGEVAALIGPNGAGKSTFVKTALGDIPPLAGEVKIGASVKIGYFAQAHEALNPKNTLIDEILASQEMLISEARSYLGAYLF
ncbi:MAG: ABC transporter ATP-binding protein, partial [Phototrophicales bacterium]